MPFGAVRPLLRPSWFTADPRITAITRSPSDTASQRRLSTITPPPSPRTYPSAPASNVRQRPPLDIILACENTRVGSADSNRLTPPANARLHSPRLKLLTARCVATSDDEQ